MTELPHMILTRCKMLITLSPRWVCIILLLTAYSNLHNMLTTAMKNNLASCEFSSCKRKEPKTFQLCGYKKKASEVEKEGEKEGVRETESARTG